MSFLDSFLPKLVQSDNIRYLKTISLLLQRFYSPKIGLKNNFFPLDPQVTVTVTFHLNGSYQINKEN